MLTFREFYEICEDKKPDTPPHAVPGTYVRHPGGMQTYTLQRYEGPEGKPTKKEVNKLIVKRSGGKEVTKRLKKLAKSVNKIEEDLQQRRQELRQRQLKQMATQKQKVSDYQATQKEKVAAQIEAQKQGQEERRAAQKEKEEAQRARRKQEAEQRKAEQREKAEAARKQLNSEIDEELQTEQTPTMEPNLYSQQVARRQATQKTAHIKHVHQELGAEARAQQSEKRARMKAIMNR